MLFCGRSTCDTGVMSSVQQCQISRGPNNIVLEGMGVRVKLKDEEVERSMIFNHFYIGFPRTFGDYCILYSRYLWRIPIKL